MSECRFLSPVLLLLTVWSAAARENAALPSIAGIRQQQQQQARTRPLENIMVIHPAGADPFSVPEISTGAMRGFEARQFTGFSRHRLTGTITFIEPGSHIFLQADNRGVRAVLAAGQTAAAGDLVEASGFVRMNGPFAELTHTLIRPPGTPPPPGPEPLTVSAATLSSILSPSFDQTMPPPPDIHCRLVTLQGILLKADSNPGGKPILWIEIAGNPPVNVPVTIPAGVIPPRDGSQVEIRGVCELVMGEPPSPDSIPVPTGLRVFLGSGKDLRVIREAPAGIPVRQWMLAGGAATAFALILLQVRSLRRQVRIAAAALAEAGVQRRAAEVRAEERQRLTEEIHDIMAQSLTGVALQLGAADLARISAPAEVPHHLKLASGLLNFTRDEIRRTLFDLRSSLLDKGDLAGSLKNMAEMFVKTGGCGVEWEIIGVPSHVHPLTVHSLLRVIQEGMNNALTHGRATRIDIRIDYSPSGGISIVLRDNGQGSSSCTRPGPAEGHFGLESMRGRIRRLGGNFKFTSQPGKGAIVEASIPLQPDSPLSNSTSSAADYSPLAVSGAAANS